MWNDNYAVKRSKCKHKNQRWLSKEEFDKLGPYDFFNPHLWYSATMLSYLPPFFSGDSVYVKRVSPWKWLIFDGENVVRAVNADGKKKYFRVDRTPYGTRKVPNQKPLDNAFIPLQKEYAKEQRKKQWHKATACFNSEKHEIKKGDQVYVKILDGKLIICKEDQFILLRDSRETIAQYIGCDIYACDTCSPTKQQELNLKSSYHLNWHKAQCKNRKQFDLSTGRPYVRRTANGRWVIYDYQTAVICDDDYEFYRAFSIMEKVSDSRKEAIEKRLQHNEFYDFTITYETAIDD